MGLASIRAISIRPSHTIILDGHGRTLDIGSTRIRCSDWAEPHYVTVKFVDDMWPDPFVAWQGFKILNCPHEPVHGLRPRSPHVRTCFVLRYLGFVVADRLAEAVDVRCASAIRGSSITFARHRWDPTHRTSSREPRADLNWRMVCVP